MVADYNNSVLLFFHSFQKLSKQTPNKTFHYLFKKFYFQKYLGGAAVGDIVLITFLPKSISS